MKKIFLNPRSNETLNINFGPNKNSCSTLSMDKEKIKKIKVCFKIKTIKIYE